MFLQAILRMSSLIILVLSLTYVADATSNLRYAKNTYTAYKSEINGKFTKHWAKDPTAGREPLLQNKIPNTVGKIHDDNICEFWLEKFRQKVLVLERLNDQLNEQLTALKTQNATLVAKLKQKNDANIELSEKIEEQRGELEQEKSVLEADKIALMLKLKKEEENKIKLTSELDKISAQLQQQITDKRAIEKKLLDLEGIEYALQQQLTETKHALESKNTKLSKELADKYEEIENKQQQKQDLELKLRDKEKLQQQLVDSNQQNTDLELQLLDKNKLQQTLADANQQIKDLERQLRNKDKLQQQLAEANQQQKKDLELKLGDNDKLQQKLVDSNQQNTDLQLQLRDKDKFQQTLADANQQIKDLKLQLGNKDMLQQKLEDASQQIEEQNEQIQTFKAEKVALELQKKSLDSKLAEAKTENEQLQKKQSTLAIDLKGKNDKSSIEQKLLHSQLTNNNQAQQLEKLSNENKDVKKQKDRLFIYILISGLICGTLLIGILRYFCYNCRKQQQKECVQSKDIVAIERHTASTSQPPVLSIPSLKYEELV